MNRRFARALEASTKKFVRTDTGTFSVGIDASLTKFGVCAFSLTDGEPTALLHAPKDRDVQRLDGIEKFVTNFILGLERMGGVSIVVLEGYAMGIRGGRSFSIGEGGGAAKLGVYRALGPENPVAYPRIVTPTALKKFATGKGKAEKNAVVLAAYKKWGADFDGEDNLTDAYVLARIGAAIITGETGYGYESDVVAALEPPACTPKKTR